MNNEVIESELLVELRELIALVLDIDEEMLTNEAQFVDDLGVDSLVALELMVNLERKYKLKLAEEDLREMTSLNGVYQFLLNRLGKS